MKALEAISAFIGKYMSVIVFLVALLSLFVPQAGLWISTTWINPLLMVVMFGMGLTLNLHDFKVVFTKPKGVIIGCLTQFIAMPLLAFTIGKLLHLDAALLAGLVLVGTCPGGTASNVMTYLAKGDTALSVGMTSVNTLLAPIMTPTITYVLLKTTVDVDVLSMFLSIIKVVIVPIALGLIINHFFGEATAKASKALPLISVIAITLIVATVVSHNSEKIFSTGAMVFVSVILLNLGGYLVGFLMATIFKLKLPSRKAMAIEIGMQNSGLSTSLATTTFPDLAMATVPGAVFSVWHNISGAILANILRQFGEKEEN